MIQRTQILKSSQQSILLPYFQLGTDFHKAKSQIQKTEHNMPSTNFEFPFYASQWNGNHKSFTYNQLFLRHKSFNPFWPPAYSYPCQQVQDYNCSFHSPQQIPRPAFKQEAVKIENSLIKNNEALESANEQKSRKVLLKSKRAQGNYYWNQSENQRYVQHLRKYSKNFMLPLKQKKKMRINVTMSKKIKTRSPEQCHSHHQKMMKKFGSIKNIINAMGNSSINLNKPKSTLEVKIEEDPINASDVPEKEGIKWFVKIEEGLEQ